MRTVGSSSTSTTRGGAGSAGRGGDNGGCLFVARHPDTGMVGVRDSKHPTDPPQWYTQTEWSAFLTGVHAGEFDTI